MSKPIPTILNKMIVDAKVQKTSEPSYQCQAGFCGQCVCDIESLEAVYGELEYIIEPAVPPFEGQILPCIARERVRYFDLNEFPGHLASVFEQVSFVKQKSLKARLPSDNEIGVQMKVPSSKKKSHILSIGIPSQTSVIVQSTEPGQSGSYSAMLSTLEDFKRSFGDVPRTSDYSLFTKDVEYKGVYVNQAVFDYIAGGNDDAYVKTATGQVVVLEVGDIIVNSGAVIDRKNALALNLTFLSTIPNHSI